MNYEAIKKVHVVFKTHLDIGFTVLAQNVLDRYVNEHIPHAVELAFQMNTPDDKKFIWTVGSFLLDYYAKTASPQAVQRMCEAIKLGYFRWHALACTTHTELMSRRLFEYDLQISRKLDRQFGTKTTVAKMTDVPGHTIAILEPMADAGIQYLHIGVNPACMVPQVPEVFRWRHNGRELVVHYSGGYGAPLSIEGFDEAIEFAHTGDNMGPQDAQQVLDELARIQALYPNAQVQASTLDDFASSLLKIKDRLPIVEEEIGDTWIHGVGSDPWKVSRFQELLHLMDRWLAEGLITQDSEAYDHFMMNLMLVAEHTWGLNFEVFLADYINWRKTDFQKARIADRTTLDFVNPRDSHIRAMIEGVAKRRKQVPFEGSYRYYESSFAEQREYLYRALQKLPLPLKEEAESAMDALSPHHAQLKSGTSILPGAHTVIQGWKVGFDGHGAIHFLEKNGHSWVRKGELGRLQYEIFDAMNCQEAYHRYARGLIQNADWADSDLSKPGLQSVEELRQTCYDFYVSSIQRENNTVVVTLCGDEEACESFGCPRQAQIIYTFEPQRILCRLQWFQKDANKIPEALWFKFQFDVDDPFCWTLNKMGQPVSPLHIVRGGNRKQHCVQELTYRGADGEIRLIPYHSPLVSVGARNLYTMDHKVDPLENGFYFNLFNNRWGTNFPMWCEDACSFTYEIRLAGNCVKPL